MEFIVQYWHVLLVGALLLFLSFGFLRKFVAPASVLGRQLDDAIHKLEAIQKENGGRHFTDVDRIANEAMVNERLAHCWSEFRETLHPQMAVNSDGQEEVARWRATALAETFFTDQALVETPLKTEFYKHLPGILTGIGILGTFSGLILGLVNFNVSNDADAVRKSLADLIQHVGHAFIVSATAIGLAMLFTWIEKSLVTARFRQVEKVCRLLDSMFDAGAGEEYLSRLVEASETSATQSTHLKDALVADLKQILSEVTRQQVEAMAANNRQLSDTFTQGLKEPLERISTAVESVSGNQGEAVNRLLTDVLSGFTTQMQDMFGGQLKGMNDVLQQTSVAVQEAASKFDQLAGGLQDAGRHAVDEMAKRLDDALVNLELRQKDMNATMSAFIEAIRTQVSDSQKQTADNLTTILGDLGTQTAALMGALQDQGKQASETHAKQQEQFAQHSKATLDELAGNVRNLTDSVQVASESMKSAVSSLAQSTQQSLDSMRASADTLLNASTTLGQGLGSMNTVVERIGGATEKLNLAAQSLNGATQAAMRVIQDYTGAQEAFKTMLADLKQTVENASRDAALTSQLIRQIEDAAQKLAAAEQDASDYLEGVSSVLAETHDVFASSIKKTLHEGNSQFHKELAEATNILKGAIQELGDTLDIAAARA